MDHQNDHVELNRQGYENLCLISSDGNCTCQTRDLAERRGEMMKEIVVRLGLLELSN